MKSFFNLIYIVPNQYSKEQICVGLIANIGGVPYLGISNRKLNFALSLVNIELRSRIRKSFRLLDFDVNKIRRGQEPMPLFDAPYSFKLLKELAAKKRGIVSYSEVYELDQSDTGLFNKLFLKFTGEEWGDEVRNKGISTFKKRFKEFVSNKKFDDFERNYKLSIDEFPLLLKSVKVDLFRKKNFITVFIAVDLEANLTTIHRNLAEARIIIQSLVKYSEANGFGKGRYYFVVESPKSLESRSILAKLQTENNPNFEVIKISEMRDKI